MASRQLLFFPRMEGKQQPGALKEADYFQRTSDAEVRQVTPPLYSSENVKPEGTCFERAG